MDEKLVVMPSEEAIVRRLKDGLDEELHSEKLFSMISQALASKELYADGIVTVVMLAIHDYAERLAPTGWNVMSLDIPQYLKALIADDEVRQAATEFYQELWEATRAA